MERETLWRIVRWYMVGIVVTAIIYAALSQWKLGLHYAIDTMTLRGRLPDPTESEIPWWLWRWTFYAIEDLASLGVFILLGFGIGWVGKFLEEQRALVEYTVEVSKRAEMVDFMSWLEAHDPRLHADLTRPALPDAPLPHWKTFREWLKGRERR